MQGGILDHRATLLGRADVLRAAVVGVDARKAKIGARDDRLDERQRRPARRDAAAAHADFQLDIGFHGRARALRRRLQVAHVVRVVDADADARALRERGEALELARAHDFIRDQHVADAALDHRLGLRHLLAAHAHRAGRDLALADFGALVGLGVRAHPHAALHEVREPFQVGLERVQVEDQRRRIDLLQPHAHFGWRSRRHVLFFLISKNKYKRARTTTAIRGMAAKFTFSQPALVTIMPEENDEIAIIAKIAVSFAPWALARSSGR